MIYSNPQVMKKIRIISLILVLIFAVSCFVGCGKKDAAATGSNKVIWYVTGVEEPDNQEVFKLANERIKEETGGLYIEFKYIDDAQYDLQFSAGDEFDLILCPDHKGYWQNVEKGAFQEITEEDFKTYAPYIWENGQEYLDVSKWDGKYYCVPGFRKYAPDRTLVARGDYMDKYGIESLDTIDDISEFLLAGAKDKSHNIVPFNCDGNNPWMIFNMWASDWGWACPGSLSFGSHYYFDTNKDDFKIFLMVDRAETKQFSEDIKEWYDSGVFSKSVLSNATTGEEAFRNGKSLLAWTSSPSAANNIWREIPKIPGADKWDVRFYSMYSKQQRAYNYMNTAVGISRTSKNKANALRVLDTIYANKDIYRLLCNGIEGKDYTNDANGYQANLESNYSAPNLGITNDEHKFTTKYDYPYAEALVEELAGKTIADPLVNCPITSDGDFASMKVKLDDVFAEYSKPRMYGAVANVDEALKKEKAALKAADIDKFVKHVQNQVDKFVADHPDAMENFYASRKAVQAYNKANPNKTNPKDYK